MVRWIKLPWLKDGVMTVIDGTKQLGIVYQKIRISPNEQEMRRLPP
jgi:hypothetical protein